MRIAVGGLHTECSTYNPVLMTIRDFRVLRGAALTAHPEFRALRDYPHEFVPTLHARAVPGGPIARAAYVALRDEFLDRLRAAAPVDALYGAMHGAAFVEGMDDAEGDWLAAARAVVGPACLIAVSYDLHGNLSQRIVDQVDLFSAYRTAPHIDVEETQRRVCAMLDRCLREHARPVVRWAPVPVLLQGERTSTVDEPARSLYAALPAVDTLEGVLDASLLVGYVWADEARATAAVVLTGSDAAVLEQEAAGLARRYWDARHQFRYGTRTGSIDECLDWAVGSGSAPVVLADSGDNPTAGGVGDRADLLGALLARGVAGALVAGITDPPSTEACYRCGTGGTLDLRIGAALDPRGSAPIAIRAEVVRLDGAADADERQAVVRAGGISVVLTSRRRPFHDLRDFARLGLDPASAPLVVVKSGYLSPELAPIANPAIMALSPGAVDQHVEQLPRGRGRRPMYPFDRDFAWEPVVRASARSLGGTSEGRRPS